MRWVLITHFGTPVEPEVNRNLAIAVGTDRVVRGVDLGARRRLGEIGEASDAAVRRRVAGDDEFDAVRHRRIDGAREQLSVGGKHQPGREQVDDRTQLAEIARHQRIGRRNRRMRNAGIKRAERDQRVLDVVAGQDRDRPLGGQIAREQGFADAAGKFQRLFVGDRAPVAIAVALGEEGLRRRFRRPELQPLGQLVGIDAERLRRTQQNRCRRRGIRR